MGTRARTATSSSSNGGGGSSLGAHVGSLLLLVGGAFAVGSALLARQGFTGRDHVVGVDLGTTYSVVAISQRNNVSVIPDAFGHVIIPSIVAFLPRGETLVGRQARAHRTKDPQHTVFNAKRFIGRQFDDVVQSGDAAAYEFAVARAASPGGGGGVCFPLAVAGHPACVSPVAVGAAVVRHLRAMAQRFVGHAQITKAVIAVPVDFDAAQRAATQRAFRAAGLQVSRVLEEPTAAAIAYGLHQDPTVSFVLVFDFGGGTLDVSLLFARSGSISVVDTLGDNHLGGEDIDAQVAAFLTREIAAQIGTTLTSTASEMEEADSDTNEDPTQLPCTPAGIRRAAELLKRALSAAPSARASCVVQSSGARRRAGDTVSVLVTRAQFEELCADLLARTLAPVREIIAANHMTPDEVDAVVLVGGSSRIPWVRASLTALFGGRAPLATIDPDVAVAYGAARVVD
ncbi:hypothetical protein PybrP1_012704 [[Pythium] brassicae (nom. inval.)]|nr:hypothetical protein PybrP1_012704 [[Pythium] brassicae (nom. inval.)]